MIARGQFATARSLSSFCLPAFPHVLIGDSIQRLGLICLPYSPPALLKQGWQSSTSTPRACMKLEVRMRDMETFAVSVQLTSAVDISLDVWLKTGCIRSQAS